MIKSLRLKNKNNKILLLFSGGLDSLLVAKLFQKNKLKVTGLVFTSPFFDSQKAEKWAKKINLPLKIIDISQEFIEILKKPKFGYGQGMNPCLDCKILMLKKAKEILKKENYHFLASGEVLSQRPFSQNYQNLRLIAKAAKVEKILLRPLSGKILQKERVKETPFKNIFLSLQGKSRKEQILLAKKLKIKNWPSPSGGCLLTQPEFSLKVKKLLSYLKKPEKEDFLLLKTGRHFFEKNLWIVVGRNQEENLILEKTKKPKGIIARPKFKGPTIFFPHQKKVNLKIKKLTKKFLSRYSKKKKVDVIKIFNLKS